MIAGHVTDQVISWEQMRFSANQKVDPDSFKVWLNIRTNSHKLTTKQTFLLCQEETPSLHPVTKEPNFSTCNSPPRPVRNGFGVQASTHEYSWDPRDAQREDVKIKIV